MSTVEEIERAIEQLPAHDLTRIAAWLLQRDNEAWNRCLENDSATGRLNFLFEEAAAENSTEKLRDWPPARP